MINDRRRRFVDEYLIDLNATQAAIRAGYSAKTAQHNAVRLMANDGIQKLIAEKQKKLAIRTEITQEMVVRELAKIGFSDIRRAVKWSPTLGEHVIDDAVVTTNGVLLVDSDQLDDDTAAAVSEISQTAQGIKIKLHDKRQALVDIGRHLGMFNDKLTLGADDSFKSIVEAALVRAKSAD